MRTPLAAVPLGGRPASGKGVCMDLDLQLLIERYGRAVA
jgi:hypothetical protein